MMSERLTPDVISAVVNLIPDAWLARETQFAGPAEHRAAYARYLSRRLEPPRFFVEEVRSARTLLV